MSTRFNTSALLDFREERVLGLDIRLEESALVWPLIKKLEDELAQAGISFRPAYYVANEWGCPDGQPLIGIPFYLVDARLHPYEEEFADDLEDEGRIMAGLRHEAGHAICYAYRLYDDPEWRALFGRFEQPYQDDYLPVPFSRECVRHLPGWYAQKHPDEDFAETFAVWLTPGSDWRARYQGWDTVLAKLEYVDRAMKRLAGLAPSVDPRAMVPDPEELAFTVGEFYQHRHQIDVPPADLIGDRLDADFREMFPASGIGTDASSLVLDRRRAIMKAVSSFAGSRMYVVKALVDWMAERLKFLGVRAAKGGEADAIIGITALASTLTHNFLRTGRFV